MRNNQNRKVTDARSGQDGTRKNSQQQPSAKTAKSEGLSRRSHTAISVVANAIDSAVGGDEWMLWV